MTCEPGLYKLLGNWVNGKAQSDRFKLYHCLKRILPQRHEGHEDIHEEEKSVGFLFIYMNLRDLLPYS
jgi:hypothetical protein